MEKEFKSGFVAMLGRTNVGKSTLVNLLVGEKVAATANKVQTTRTAIKGIVNRENSQIIFTDTPGIHKPKHKLNETMVETSFTSLKDADVILFLIEANSKEIGRGDNRIIEKIKEANKKTIIETSFGVISEIDLILFVIEATSEEIGRGDMRILEKIKESNKKAILIINKIDLVKREKLLKLIDMYQKEYRDIILDEIEKNLKPGPAYYDTEEYTDQTLRQLAEETIREKALMFLQDEVPHGIYVEVEKMKFRKNQKGEPIYDIEATIYCLRNSHKGIIIGKNGEMLKRIGRAARIDMEQNFGLKVNLKTWVKVKEDWQDDTSIVKKFKLQ